MAIATFGNFQVDMTNPDFLDAIIGTNLDDDPQVSVMPTQIIETFPTNWVFIFQGNFTL